jgi:hypothetical protein
MDAPIVVRAEVELFSGEVSGKTTGYASGARPNHYIAELESMAIGELRFEGRASLGPGERATATIVFLPWAPLLPLLRPGFEWRLQEGRRVVGKAQLVEVLSGA